jgi:hypothetical protein
MPAQPIEAPVAPPEPRGGKNTIVTDEAMAAIRARLAKPHTTPSSFVIPLDAERLKDLLLAGTYHFERGARTAAAFTKAMVEDFGEWVREHAAAIYAKVKSHPEFAVEKPTAEGITKPAETVKSGPAGYPPRERVPSGTSGADQGLPYVQQVRQQLSEKNPPGTRRPFTEPVPPEAKAKPEPPKLSRATLPNDMTAAQLKLIADNLPTLRRNAIALERKWPGSDADDGLNSMYKSAKSYDPKEDTAFTTWAYAAAARDMKASAGLAAKGKRMINEQGRVVEGVGAPATPADQIKAGASDPALEHINDSIDRTDDMHERLGKAQEGLDAGWELDKNIGPEETKGAYTAATSGKSYVQFAKDTGITEHAARKVYASLGARARAFWDAAGLPVDAGEIKIGELRVPASGSNELGVRAAAHAPEPTDLSQFTPATKNAISSERWKALPAGEQNKWQRYFQRLYFGMKADSDNAAIKGLNDALASFDSLEPAKLGTGNLQRQAAIMAKHMFGEDTVKSWFSDGVGQPGFMKWLQAAEKLDRGTIPGAWRSGHVPGEVTAPTPSGAATMRVNEDSAGRIWILSSKMWGEEVKVFASGHRKLGPARIPGRDEVAGTLSRLEYLIKTRAIEPGDRIVFPEALRKEHAGVFDEFKNRYLKPQTIVSKGRDAAGDVIYAVRNLPGGGAAHPKPSAQADFLGLATASDLAKRGLSNAPEALSHGANLFASGVRDFATWSGHMVKSFGSSISKWLGELWVRVSDAAERWADRRSEKMKDFLVAGFETTPSRFGPGGKIAEADAKQATLDAAERYETLGKFRKATATPKQGEELIAQTARAMPDELALALSGELPLIVKPGSLLEKAVEVLRTKAKHGAHVDEQAQKEMAFLSHVLNPAKDNAMTIREKAVVEAAMPMLATHTEGELLESLTKKLGSSLTYAEAYTAKNLRDILGVKFAEAKELTQQGAADFASKAIDRTTYDQMLAKAAGLEAEAGHAIILAGNVGTYAGRLLRFQQLITRPGETLSFRNRFMNSAREGLKIGQAEAEALYQVRMDYAEGRIDQAAYLDKLHGAAKFNKSDKLIEYIKATYMTPLSPISAFASNTLGIELSRLEARVGAGLSPLVEKIFGRGLETELAAGPRQHAMPWAFENHLRALAHTENMGMIRDEAGNIFFGRPLAHAEGESVMTEMGLRQGGAIPGRAGELLRSIPKTLHVIDQIGQKTMIYLGMGQHAWNEAVTAAKTSGTHMDQAALVSDSMQRLAKMRDVAETLSATGNDVLTPKHGREIANQLKEQYKVPLQHIANDAQAVTMALAFGKQPYFTKAAEVGGKLSEWAAGKVWGALFLPFVRTGTNVAIRSMLYTPLGVSQIRKALLEGKISPAQWDRDIIKPLLGTAVMGAVIPMAVSGNITGGGPDDPKKQQQLRATGWQPYSIRIGSQYLNYQRLEPLASILSFAADLGESFHRGTILDENGDLDPVKLATHSIGSAKNAALSKTFFTQLESMFAASSDPQRYGERFMKQLAGTVVPNALGLVPVGALARAMDPVIRQTSFWTAAQAKIPFGPSEALPAQISPLGSEIQRPGTVIERLLSPFPRTSVKEDKVADVARELDRIDYVPSRPPSYIRINGRKIYYTERELGALDAQQLQTTNKLYQLLRSDSYKRAPEHENDARAIAGTKTKSQLVEAFYRSQRGQESAMLRPAVERRMRQGQVGAPVR